jgi:hypothetical protein
MLVDNKYLDVALNGLLKLSSKTIETINNMPDWLSSYFISLKEKCSEFNYKVNNLRDNNIAIIKTFLEEGRLVDAGVRIYLAEKLISYDNKQVLYLSAILSIAKKNYEEAKKILSLLDSDESKELLNFLNNIQAIAPIPKNIKSLLHHYVEVPSALFREKSYLYIGTKEFLIFIKNNLKDVEFEVGKILEYNCGFNLIRRLLEQDKLFSPEEIYVHGTDLSQEYVTQMQKDEIASFVYKSIDLDEIETYELSDPVDLVVAGFALDYNANIGELINSVIKNLRQGGYIYLAFRIDTSISDNPNLKYVKSNLKYIFSLQDIEKAFQNSKLEIVKSSLVHIKTQQAAFYLLKSA